jgi:hypothetical protein
VATKLALFVRRHPAALAAVAVVASVVGGHFGIGLHIKLGGGLWDGPV